MSLDLSDNRHTHIKSTPSSSTYQSGKSQAAIALERFHYLCASIQGKYAFVYNIPPDPSRGQYFPRQGLVFSYYEAYHLEPIVGLKLHPRADGSVHPKDIELYQEMFKNGWRHAEGGILYSLSEQREFYNCILNYHGPAKTTGNEEWDKFFEELKESGYDKGKVPCMYFSRKSGCLNADCPFLHDEAASRERRNKLLEARRKTLFEPTPKERFKYTQQKYKDQKDQKSKKKSNNPFYDSALSVMGSKSLGAAFSSMSLNNNGIDVDEDDDTEDEETKIRVPRVRHFCANPECMKPQMWKSKGEPPLRRCAKCLWACYCSSACQRTDWSRHKKECAPAEEIIEKDELWTPVGTRKGTEPFNIEYADDSD